MSELKEELNQSVKQLRHLELEMAELGKEKLSLSKSVWYFKKEM